MSRGAETRVARLEARMRPRSWEALTDEELSARIVALKHALGDCAGDEYLDQSVRALALSYRFEDATRAPIDTLWPRVIERLGREAAAAGLNLQSYEIRGAA